MSFGRLTGKHPVLHPGTYQLSYPRAILVLRTENFEEFLVHSTPWWCSTPGLDLKAGKRRAAILLVWVPPNTELITTHAPHFWCICQTFAGCWGTRTVSRNRLLRRIQTLSPCISGEYLLRLCMCDSVALVDPNMVHWPGIILWPLPNCLSTRPLRVSCDVWHQEVSSRFFKSDQLGGGAFIDWICLFKTFHRCSYDFYHSWSFWCLGPLLTDTDHCKDHL